MKWFRFYDEVVDDPKVQLLPDKQFKAWVSLLCLASRNGGKLPAGIKDVAYALRCTERQASSRIDELVTAGLFEHDGLDLIPHNWNGRQYKSDDSGNRVKAFRERQSNGDVTANVTPSETETETETEAEQSRTEAEQSADAEALPLLALAQKVAAELCLTGRSWIDAISGAIEFCVKYENKPVNQAVEFLIAEAKASIKRGSAPNVFWFTERKWQKTGGNSGNYPTVPRAGKCKKHPNIATQDGKCPMCNPESPEETLRRIRGKANAK